MATITRSAGPRQAGEQIPFMLPPPPPVLRENRTSGGASDVGDSQATAPLRRKTSMGSFQRGMGESLTGRLRKQLDIPREPKIDINTNIGMEQVQDLQYLAQVRETRFGGEITPAAATLPGSVLA